MFGWLSKNSNNERLVADLISKQSVQARFEAEELKRKRREAQLYQQFLRENCPLNERKTATHICGIVVDGVIDSAMRISELRQQVIAADTVSAAADTAPVVDVDLTDLNGDVVCDDETPSSDPPSTATTIIADSARVGDATIECSIDEG